MSTLVAATTVLENTELDDGEGVMHVLDRSGDMEIRWKRNDPASVQAARDTFDAQRAKGMSAYRVGAKGAKGEQVTTFDPAAEKLVIAPRLVGG